MALSGDPQDIYETDQVIRDLAQKMSLKVVVLLAAERVARIALDLLVVMVSEPKQVSFLTNGSQW